MAATSLYYNLAKLGRVQLPSGTEYALIDYNGRELITEIFNPEASYTAGDYILYSADGFGSELFRFTTNKAAGAWDSTKVQGPLTVGDELGRLEDLISGGVSYIGKTTTQLHDGDTSPVVTIGGSSYTASAGNMTIVDRSGASINYTLNTAYNKGTYIKYGSPYTYWIVNDDITSTENTSWSAISGKVDVLPTDPEYIYSGTEWNLIGSIDGFGDLAFKDSVTGSYVAPTGSGSVTILRYADGANDRLVTTSITGVEGTESVSKMTAGTAVNVATVGTAVRYGTANVGTAVIYGTANKAASATTVGNANVGSAVTVGNADVGEAVTVATAGAQVVYGNADVGTAVTYGNANTGTTITGVAKVGSSKTFTIEGVTASVSGDCLQFATASTNSVIGIADTTGISITPAVASNTTLTPAKAADSTRKLTPVGETIDITPAVTSTSTITPAVASTTTIYGAVDSSSTLTPAVAAPNDQTIVPAVANGSITPWTETAKTVAVAASQATTVATGSVSLTGTGAHVMTTLHEDSDTATVTVGTTTGTIVSR